jgi:hypothetical protein
VTYSMVAFERMGGDRLRDSPMFHRLAGKGPGAERNGETPA